jgi:hypothetical protein
MKSFFVLMFAFAMTEQALACTYDPQIETNKKLLYEVALKKLGVSTKSARSYTVEFDFQETKPTRMCPNEIQYTGVYTITWTSGNLGVLKPCSGVVTVVKKVNYEKSRSKPRVRTTAKTGEIICAP